MSKSLNDYLSSENEVDNKEDYKKFKGFVLYYTDSICGIWFCKNDDLYIRKAILVLENVFHFPLQSDDYSINLDKAINFLNEKYKFVKENPSINNIDELIYSDSIEVVFEDSQFEKISSFDFRIKIINNEEELEK